MVGVVDPQRRADPIALVRPFPQPGPQLQLAYRELDLAANGTDEERAALGTIRDLPKPWAPATCTKPQLRAELWNWLDAVVVWLNHELVFDTVDVIPSCWPKHPHLVHELAVLADLRRRADRALTSDALEEWHRYALPTFLERMRHRIAEHCNDDHPTVWPSAGRFNRHLDDERAIPRQRAFADDLTVTRSTKPLDAGNLGNGPRLRVVDTDSGEILD